MPCCVNAVFKVLVGLRAEKQRDSGQEPNLAVPCDTWFCRHKDVMKNQSISPKISGFVTTNCAGNVPKCH